MSYLLKNFHIMTWTQKYRTYQNCYVTGFVAKKTISHTDCNKCKAKLGSVGKPLELFVDEKSHNYFDLINRGGLTFPSNFLFIITQFAYLIFNVCISTLETEFLQLAHQKQTYLGVVNGT